MCEYCEPMRAGMVCAESFIDESLDKEELPHLTGEAVGVDVYLEVWKTVPPVMAVDLVDERHDLVRAIGRCINYCPMCGRKLGEVNDEQQS